MTAAARPDEIPGVNLWGYLRTESGVGEHARTLLAALDEARVPVAPIDFPDTRSRRDHPLPFGTRDEPGFDLHLICVNADQTPHFVERVGAARLGGYRIGYWHWEVEEFPDLMAESADLVDEIWTASRHSAEAIRRKVSKPVHVVPPAVDPPAPTPPPDGVLPPGDGPLFLTCFDFDSVIERKNPEGAMAAFRLAFPAGGARLLVKSVNGHLHPERLAALAAVAADRADIRVVDRYLERDAQAGLIAACDAFLSLHRAEGFGLMLAEAIWFGRPVVATGYSGNLEFMDPQTAALVPWRPTPIPPGAGPYSGRWAEPDLEAAADALRRRAAASFQERAADARAARALAEGFGVRAAGERARRELARISAARAGEAPAPADLGDLETLAERIERGPDPNVAAALGSLGRLLRRLALRAHRHAGLHQREIDRELLALVRRERIARARAESDRGAMWVAAQALAEGAVRRLLRSSPSGGRMGGQDPARG